MRVFIQFNLFSRFSINFFIIIINLTVVIDMIDIIIFLLISLIKINVVVILYQSKFIFYLLKGKSCLWIGMDHSHNDLLYNILPISLLIGKYIMLLINMLYLILTYFSL